MNRATLAAAAAIVAVAALPGCSSSSTTASTPAVAAPPAGASSAAPTAAAPAAKPKVDAARAVAAITKAVPTAKQGVVITDANDRNHLLGRPGQYTSKVTFTDSRIQAGDVDGLDPDDVERGGTVEVFATPADAKARADYIQGVVKSLPALLEYDYPHGAVLVRLSRFLSPSQASDYDKVGASLG
jgi:hypothetical protein